MVIAVMVYVLIGFGVGYGIDLYNKDAEKKVPAANAIIFSLVWPFTAACAVTLWVLMADRRGVK